MSKIQRTIQSSVVLRRLITTVAVTVSALVQAYAIMACLKPAGTISSGFTGLALLVEYATKPLGFTIPAQIGMIVMNIPIAIMCWKAISRHFVVMSTIQMLLTTLFMTVIPWKPLFTDDVLMLNLLGGVIDGVSVAIALLAGACTMGTDLISMYVSKKTGKQIWGAIFAGNVIMYIVFGFLVDWKLAMYSVVFQFVETKVIEEFYKRFDKTEITITSRHGAEIKGRYAAVFKHGMSTWQAVGARTGDYVLMLRTVVSNYEVSKVLAMVYETDPVAFVTTSTVKGYYGRFYSAPVDEPVIVNVPIKEGTTVVKPSMTATESLNDDSNKKTDDTEK